MAADPRRRTAAACFAFNGHDGARETFQDPARGDISWRTLFSGDTTPSEQLSGGIAEIEPRGTFSRHRHDHAEVYFVLEGTIIVTVDGAETIVPAGSGIFIAGNAEHGCRNDGDGLARFFYVFAADRFSDVVYRFSPKE